MPTFLIDNNGDITDNRVCPLTVTMWAMFNLQPKSSLTFLTILNKTHDMNPVHNSKIEYQGTIAKIFV